ncbi:anaphase promoting complex subunit 8 [Emericellopsis atlantica]|uniref:Anaphase promoting complex subunit 8 n=1 Tax=Emericellopsis atlantica TaxID=2614577 RepID=A0A9P7ZNL1_9HYPO|nr:anaphase promoting complex subunit 8 [Emericellopsis atlantica]KAG9255429.1 anaphase promoting complex subunit 8 [Emericellopsis atlantica]
MGLSPRELASLRNTLADATVKCAERGLYQSSKWAAELMNSLPDFEEEEANLDPPEEQIPSPIYTPNLDPSEAALEARELPKYLLAKSFFDCHEYDRCASVFIPDTLLSSVLQSKPDGAPPTPKGKGKEKASSASTFFSSPRAPAISQKSLFLALYAKFLAGEKRKNEEAEMVMGPHDHGSVINKELLVVGRLLSAWFEAKTPQDEESIRAAQRGELPDTPESQGWLEYLYGMVLAREKSEDLAMKYLVRSVHKYQFNWGCWLEMTSLISRPEHLSRTVDACPEHLISYMFHLHSSLELYQQSPALAQNLDKLYSIFPHSPFLLTCNALLSYHSKDLLAAEQHFSRLLASHPRRLDSLDHYSNILYVLNNRPKLAFLAHLCSSVDKFRPESCVVIGNYYSLISMHEKAVQYFRRALTLDKSCLSAWTLMGHEYVELKNTHAAIESYRRAVDVNRRDYRAWYGLGQTYEMLEMHTYSLHYYKMAAGLRPWDGKMWMAVGTCLQRMEKEREAIKALKRALLADAYYETGSSFGSGGELMGSRSATGHLDPEILLQIASLYDALGEEEEAKSYMELCMRQEDGTGAEGGDAMAESVRIHNDSPPASDDGAVDEEQGGREGTGVTAATSKARMWLAKFAMRTHDYDTATQLAMELCQDGVEVEEAKALVREVRARIYALEPGSDGAH